MLYIGKTSISEAKNLTISLMTALGANISEKHHSYLLQIADVLSSLESYAQDNDHSDWSRQSDMKYSKQWSNRIKKVPFKKTRKNYEYFHL